MTFALDKPFSETNPLPVTQGTVADGANATFGAKADPADPSTDTTPVTAMSIWKQISASVQAAQISLASLLTLLGVGVATLLKLVDSAYAATHAGAMALTVRRDGAATPFTSVNGRYAPLQTDDFGSLKIAQFDHATGSPLTFTTTPKGHQQLTSLATAHSLTVPNGATWCNLQAETQDIRFLDDGTAPTASLGTKIAAGDSINYDGDLSAIQFIEVAASAKLNVLFYA